MMSIYVLIIRVVAQALLLFAECFKGMDYHFEQESIFKKNERLFYSGRIGRNLPNKPL